MNNVVGLNDLRHELWPNPQSMLISLLNLFVAFKQDKILISTQEPRITYGLYFRLKTLISLAVI